MAYQEGERAKKMENASVRAPMENTAHRFAALAAKVRGRTAALTARSHALAAISGRSLPGRPAAAAAFSALASLE